MFTRTQLEFDNIYMTIWYDSVLGTEVTDETIFDHITFRYKSVPGTEVRSFRRDHIWLKS